MCGIVGCLIKKGNVVPFLMNALDKLETRGYDGFGIGLGASQKIIKVGEKKLNILREKVFSASLEDTSGIAHNRWATKGIANELNAHPHISGSIMVVHNGDIDNYKELKKWLTESQHYSLYSETDTEVFASLVNFNRSKRGLDFFTSVQKALIKLSPSSTYAFLVMDKNSPGQIIAARRGSRPLLWSVLDGSTFISSEASALAGFVSSYQELPEGEMALFEAGEMLRIEKIVGGKADQSSETYAIDLEHYNGSEKKSGYRMYNEMKESAEAIRNAIGRRATIANGIVLGGIGDLKIQERLRNTKKFYIAGCGTSYHSALVIADVIQEISGISAEAIIASEAVNKRMIFDANETTFIAISQSGETADLVRLMKEWKPRGMLMLGIVNVPDTQITRLTDAGIHCHVGREEAVASTKGFLGQVTCGILLAIFLGQQRGMAFSDRNNYIRELLKLPEKVEEIFKQENEIKLLAEKYADATNFLFIGRKYSAFVAMEGALKLMEITWSDDTGVNAHGMSAGEMKHGKLAMIDERCPTFAIVPKDSVFLATKNNIEEIQSRKGPVILVTNWDVPHEVFHTNDVIEIPETLECLSPLLSVIPTQLFAYYGALARGVNPDKPRNLAKAVTVE